MYVIYVNGNNLIWEFSWIHINNFTSKFDEASKIQLMP